MYKRRSSSPHIVSVVVLLLLIVGSGLTVYFAFTSSKVELRLVGNKNIDFTPGEGEFEEPGYLARHCVFSRCHDLTSEVVVKSDYFPEIQAGTIGEYEINYTLDYLGKTYSDSRTVKFTDITPPELTLLGPEVVGLYVGEGFAEPGYTAIDDTDGDITASVVVSGEVNTGAFGVYKLTYTVQDAAGNSAEKSRKVFVYNYAAFSSYPISNFDELRDYIVSNGWDISFGFKNFETGYTYTFQPDKIYYGASLVKTLDAMYVYEHFGGPRNSSERSLISGAVSYSNNSSHIALVNSLGINNLREYASSIGMQHHLNGSAIYGSTYYFCDTSVADQLAEWSHLWELINTLENGWELKNYFINNFWDNLSFYGSPTHMYKNGLYGNNYHESGIMFADSPFLMTFLSTEAWRWNATYIMADLAERTYLINQSLSL